MSKIIVTDKQLKVFKIEVLKYSKTMSMIKKASLSARAEWQDKAEHNNYRLFDKTTAVKKTYRGLITNNEYLFFTLN